MHRQITISRFVQPSKQPLLPVRTYLQLAALALTIK
jgi:hypothetical protein